MPLQNRVDPFGDIVRTSARGSMMGNRGGRMHNEDRELIANYKTRRWIACVLEFRGRHRVVMAPNRYTELFFLDEAVAFAAGHRPCAECRHERFKAFQSAWQRAHRQSRPSFAHEMDRELHAARIHKRKKVTYETPAGSLPNGCFVEIEGKAYLVLDGFLLEWSWSGYRNKFRPRGDRILTVLTPEPMVRCFGEGYVPVVHESAARL